MAAVPSILLSKSKTIMIYDSNMVPYRLPSRNRRHPNDFELIQRTYSSFEDDYLMRDYYRAHTQADFILSPKKNYSEKDQYTPAARCLTTGFRHMTNHYSNLRQPSNEMDFNSKFNNNCISRMTTNRNLDNFGEPITSREIKWIDELKKWINEENVQSKLEYIQLCKMAILHEAGNTASEEEGDKDIKESLNSIPQILQRSNNSTDMSTISYLTKVLDSILDNKSANQKNPINQKSKISTNHNNSFNPEKQKPFKSSNIISQLTNQDQGSIIDKTLLSNEILNKSDINGVSSRKSSSKQQSNLNLDLFSRKDSNASENTTNTIPITTEKNKPIKIQNDINEPIKNETIINENMICQNINQLNPTNADVINEETNQSEQKEEMLTNQIEVVTKNNMLSSNQNIISDPNSSIPLTQSTSNTVPVNTEKSPPLVSRGPRRRRQIQSSNLNFNIRPLQSQDSLLASSTKQEPVERQPESVPVLEKQVSFKIVPPDMSLPLLPQLPSKSYQSQSDLVKPQQPNFGTEMPCLRKRPQRWGPRRQDRSFSDNLERDRLAEVRRARAMAVLCKLRKKVLQNRKKLEEEAPKFENYGFLAKYCILNDLNVTQFRGTFDACDEGQKSWLTIEELKMALKGVNPAMKDVNLDYLSLIMNTCDYQLSHGADFKLFSILAALSERIVIIDDWIKSYLEKNAFRMLEKKTYLCRKLWECIVDPHTKTLSMTNLIVELRAGGVTEEHIKEVESRLKSLQELTLLDFLTYIPLFIVIHSSILENPLDFTLKL